MKRIEWPPQIYGRVIVILLFLNTILITAGVQGDTRYLFALVLTVPALFYAILKSATSNHDNRPEQRFHSSTQIVNAIALHISTLFTNKIFFMTIIYMFLFLIAFFILTALLLILITKIGGEHKSRRNRFSSTPSLSAKSKHKRSTNRQWWDVVS